MKPIILIASCQRDRATQSGDEHYVESMETVMLIADFIELRMLLVRKGAYA